MKFLAGGARDQAAHLEREMREELRTRNAAQADLYLRNKTAYEKAKTDYDALSAEAKAAATEPVRPEPHVDAEVYDQPVEKFWAMMEKLYPEKSTTRMDEFRYFARRSEETIASLVQRMQSLKHALDRPEEMAVFKLIGAMPRHLGEEVTRQLNATAMEPEEWTIELYGHMAAQCTDKQAEVSRPGAPKMWCDIHKLDSHTTADCRAAPRAKSARPAAARAAQAPAKDDRGLPEPTLAQLKELWEAHHNPNAYKATIVPALGAHVAPVHSRLTKRIVDKDERLRGPLDNMQLNFIPRDFLREPHRPPPGMMTVPEGMVPVLEAEPDARTAPEPVHPELVPVEIAPGPTNDQAVLPSLETPPPAPNTVTDDTLPASFTELPADAPARQGMVYAPSVPQPALTPEQETAPTRRGKPRAALATSQDLYNPENPNISALLSHLPGSYHSDQTAGFHRSPRIDNSGLKPAMLINGRALNNLLLDSGAEAAGRSGAAAMGITPDVIAPNAIMIRTATGNLTERLDRTKEPVSFVLNPSTADEVTVTAHVVIVNQQAADTLIGMSIIGPVGLDPSFRKKRVKYYLEGDGQAPRKCFLRAKFPVDYDSPFANPGGQVLQALVGTVISRIPSPRNAQDIEFARSRIATFQAKALPKITDIFDRSMRVLATPDRAPPKIRNPAYQHLRPLSQNLVDLKDKLATPGPGLVVLELFSGLMATTEALWRQGITKADGSWDEPTALERERAMGFMDGTTHVCPSISEADRRRILGSTMDMHSLHFLVGSIHCFQAAFFTD
ncbi:hypothetical protein KFL_003910030 [Klebsormidium nitens]|uniref:Uncharacterized protein n=1 Tax=Klebsormidium nitens TaxID=105231 RepID=A0A1Y1IGY5_KLENI|nr:hypothetical protein KFL_003910030 [Klebsormidium nitens]|eukprot:GAQ87977.1 hypothetical protein KFL_003910030 [Klebsormidium nitens]